MVSLIHNLGGFSQMSVMSVVIVGLWVTMRRKRRKPWILPYQVRAR